MKNKLLLILLAAAPFMHLHGQNNWTNATSFTTARTVHSSTILQNGKVLIAGGLGGGIFLSNSELYDPTGNTWSSAGSYTGGRGAHGAVLLQDGRVMLVGGYDGIALKTAVIYNPAGNNWSNATSMTTARQYPAATLLDNGKVLVTGGTNTDASIVYSSAELYDPVGNSWSPATSMSTVRYSHIAIKLQNGKVLVIGGDNTTGTNNTAELYDPAGNSWSPAGTMSSARAFFTATLLNNGKVLAAGGWNGTGESNSADLYDTTGNNWSAAGTFTTAREGHAAGLLPNGDVLICGGSDSLFNYLNSTYIYSVSGNNWSATASMGTKRAAHRSSVLSNGKILVTGGTTTGATQVKSAELYVTTTFTAAITANNVSCFGQCDGSTVVTPSGGTLPYTYLWNTGATTSNISGLCSGTYTVTVRDANTLQTLASVSITEPLALTASISQTNVNCNGSCNGSSVVTQSGGTLPYAYSWNTGATTASISSMCIGTYTVTISDANTCQTMASVTITQPIALTVSTSQTNILCNGSCIGEADVTSSGGTSPYTYSWSTGAINSSISSLCAGTYIATIKDANACVTSSSVTITQPLTLTINTSQAYATCDGLCNGSASVAPSGGTFPYTYLWNTGATDSSISGLCIGTYMVTVQDVNICKAVATVNITQPPITTSILQTNVTCNGLCNGSADVTPSGGASPYTYSWNTGATTANVSSLCIGTYTVTIRDANTCQTVANITITQPLTLTLDPLPDDTICLNQTITITASATGGTSPYNYSWIPSAGSSGSSITVTPGVTTTYTVIVSDSQNCTDTSTFIVVVETCTGIDELTATDYFDISPNPTTGIFSVKSIYFKESEIYIYNILGEKIYELRTLQNHNSIKIDLTNQPAGLYFIQGTTQEKILSTKVVKQ